MKLVRILGLARINVIILHCISNILLFEHPFLLNRIIEPKASNGKAGYEAINAIGNAFVENANTKQI